MNPSVGAAFIQVLPRDGLSVAADVAIVAVGVALVLLALVTVLLLLRVGRVLAELRIAARQNLGPVSDRARSISDNLEFITAALRTDVERLTASVKALTERLNLASHRMEERIEEFNALMEVVQGEAEGIFLDTASTVRGVRAGARTMAGGKRQSEDTPRSNTVAQQPALEPESAESLANEGA